MADTYYEITLTNGSVLGDVLDAAVANNGTDTSLTSLALLRRGANAYADPISENFVHMLENFANAVAPAQPLTGQLWYDTSAKKIKVYDPTNSGFTSIDGTGLATGLVNAVTISLTGNVTGSTVFDGTSNVSITADLEEMGSPPGAVAGTYSLPLIVVDSKGRITSAQSTSALSNAGGVITGNVVVSNGSVNVNFGKVQEGGHDLLPAGAIIMWSGVSVPGGWKLCDGTAGTPNLSGRFVVGVSPGGGYPLGTSGGAAFQNSVSVSSSGGHAHDVNVATAGSHNHLGSTGSHILTQAELPPHTHGIQGDGFRVIGNGLAYNGSGQGVELPAIKQTLSTGNGVGHSHTIASSGDHTHTANTAIAGEHIHTVTSFDNRPPYYVLAYIMKQ